MPIEITLLSQPISLDLPPDWIGWLGLLVLGVLNVIVLVQWRGFNKRWTKKKVGGFLNTVLKERLFVLKGRLDV